MRAYEGLFLVDDGRAADNFQEVADHIKGLIERNSGSVASLEKWDSRRLAYEIAGKRRGTYILAKFNADPAQIAALERDCKISNTVTRAMILLEENVGKAIEASDDRFRPRGRKPEPKPSGDTAAKAEVKTEPKPEEPAEAEPSAPAEPEVQVEKPAEETPAEEAPPQQAPAEPTPEEPAPAEADEPAAQEPAAQEPAPQEPADQEKPV